MLFVALFIATLFLAYSNGANDNFKGVATLFGSKTTSYQTAILWATITTFAGSVCSIFIAEGLINNFSGKGLVPDEIAGTPDFHLAVAVSAGLTVIIATIAGFPISTTHSITGALVGAGLVAIGAQVNVKVLGNLFFLPLLLSPILAIPLGACIYGLSRYIRIVLGIKKEWYIGIEPNQKAIPIPQPDFHNILQCITTADLPFNIKEKCTQRYTGKFLGIKNQHLVDVGHFLSAGIISFARGLNDTPKIFSLLLSVDGLSMQWSMFAVAVGIAVGGLLKGRQVAVTMSRKIALMNPGQGFAANIVTGFLVIAASQHGLPVSTTHVAVGSIFGMGLLSRRANPRVFYQILFSWLLTLPIAVILSATAYWILHRLQT